MRRNTSKDIDKLERQLLFTFLIVCFQADADATTFVDDAFERFKVFCKELSEHDLTMSLDGFGRMVPETMRRERLYQTGERYRKAFIGWRMT